MLVQVSTAKEGKIVDGKCHALTASYIRERHQYDDTTPVCQYYEGFNMDGRESTLPYGVYNLDDLKQYGRDRNWCPYFLARFAVSIFSNVAWISYVQIINSPISQLKFNLTLS